MTADDNDGVRAAASAPAEAAESADIAVVTHLGVLGGSGNVGPLPSSDRGGHFPKRFENVARPENTMSVNVNTHFLT